MQELKDAVKRKMSFFATVQAVFWSFFGVRKGKDSAHDVANLNPVHVVIAGVLGALTLVAVLIVIVKLVLAQAIT